MTKPMDEQPKYIDIIKQIDECYKTMKSMRPLPSDGVRRYLDDFSISTSHNSNAIEGNTFTYDETRLLIKEGITNSARSFKEHSEIIGYKKAFDFLYKAVKEKTPISEDFIKKLHSMILPEEEHAGNFRETQVYIGDSFNISYTPCSPQLVPAKMAEYVSGLQKDIDANQQMMNSKESPNWVAMFHNLAKHHIGYERIHPFVDGNGRTGRLLLTYEMITCNLLPVDIRYEERTHYYSAFKQFDGKAKYSTRPESATEPMAKLLAQSELRSMKVWNETFALFAADSKKKLKLPPLEVHKTLNAIIHKERPASDAEGLTIEKGEKLYTICVYDGVSRNCILEGDDGEIVIARNVPNQAGKLIWDKFQSFGKGPDALDRAKADSAFQKNTHDMKME